MAEHVAKWEKKALIVDLNFTIIIIIIFLNIRLTYI